jgi:hypothetical protein
MQVHASRMIALCLIFAACGGSTQPPASARAPTLFLMETARLISSPTDLSTPTQMDGRLLLDAYDVPTPSAELSVYYNNDYDGKAVYGTFSFAGGRIPTPGTYGFKDAAKGTGASWGAFGPNEYTWDALSSPRAVSLTLTEVSPGAVHGSIHFAEKFTLDATF